MKAYTDIAQSKKLAEILPIESADMFWMHVEEKSPKIDFWKVETIQRNFKPYSMDIPCWSLAALLEVLPLSNILLHDDETEKYRLVCMIETAFHDSPVDACVEMIVKLKEKDLI